MINEKNDMRKESEHFFETAIDLLGIFKPDTSFVKINKEWHSLLGYTSEELEGQKLIELVHTGDLILIKSVFNTLAEGKPVSDFQIRLKRKEGEYILLEWRMLASENLIFASARDITEREKNDLLQLDPENQFSRVLSQIQLMSVVIDTKGVIKFINDPALREMGYAREELLNKNGIDLLIHNSEQGNRFREILSTNVIPDKVDVVTKTKNSGTKIISWSSTAIRDENNKLIGVALIGEDISESKLFEEILDFRYELIERLNTYDLNSLIRFTLDAIDKLTGSKFSLFRFYNEEDGTLKFQNFSTNTAANFSSVQFSDQSYKTNLAGSWADCISLRKPVIDNNPVISGLTQSIPPGHPNITRAIICPIIKDDKIVAVINVGNKETDYIQKDAEIISLLSDSLWNVLFKKITTNTLKESEEKLRALNATKDKFFSIIAHDLKSPFQGLLGSLQILSSEFDFLSNDERKLLITSIDKLSQYTYKLLENLLQWSRIQSEYMEYNIQIFNLKNSFNDTVELLSNLAHNKNISISINIPEEYFVKADLNVTLTVFRNLLSNAIKFTANNGHIKIGAVQRDSSIEVSVEDNGIGMTKEEIEDLFLIQKQQNKPGTQGETGTGLGLILCKEMLDRTGGTMKVTSKPSKGTVFSFTLPTD